MAEAEDIARWYQSMVLALAFDKSPRKQRFMHQYHRPISRFESAWLDIQRNNTLRAMGGVCPPQGAGACISLYR
jgi:hypothetical protein